MSPGTIPGKRAAGIGVVVASSHQGRPWASTCAALRDLPAPEAPFLTGADRACVLRALGA